MNKKNKQKLERLLDSAGDMALKRRARRIIEEINPQNGDKILDVGCGDGYYLYLLSSLSIPLNLVGVDFDPNALKSAKRNLRGKGIPLFEGDLMKKLPFNNNSFDKVVMSEVAEHLPNDVVGFSEVKRVMKKSGTLVVTVPNQNYPFFWDPVNWILEHVFGTHVKEGFWSGFWNQHERLYKPKQIMKAIKEAGLSIEKIESLTFWCLPFNHNMLHLAARKLYAGGLSKDMAKAINKYEINNNKKPFFIGLAFKLVNIVDKLNDIYMPNDFGVGVMVKTYK